MLGRLLVLLLVLVSGIDSEHWTTDFDMMEVFNGSGSDFCTVLADWMGLLNQGLRYTGVGNSDTHGLNPAAGYPRNYLPTMGARPQDVTAEEIIAAVRGGQVSVGGGAYLDLPDGPVFGSEVAVDGVLSVRVRVRTPPFAKVHRVLAFLNGVAVLDQGIDSAAEDIVDLDEVLDIPVDADGPLVLLALGDRRMPYVQGNTVFAFGNPIWVDADGDGAITPVGAGAIELPVMQICE